MSDTAERVPCADDLCTGTLGEQGVCNYCGRQGSGARGDDAVTVTAAPIAPAAATAEPGERVPCADDLCTGTVGEQGVCNYCGRPGH